MPDPLLNLPINKGLLDAWSTGRTIVALRQRFYPVEFFDLCSIVEEIVLRDEVVLVGKYEQLPKNFRAALQPFVAAGVFKTVLSSTRILKITGDDTKLRHAGERARSQELTSATLTDADYAVTRLLGAEIDLKVPTIALLQHLHNYQFVRRPILDNTVCDLVAQYEDLKTRAETAKALDYRRLALRQIKVPPIALQVMQRARTFDQLTREILEVRHEFRHARGAMRELAEMLADPDLSSEALFRLVAVWENRWRKLFDAVPSCSMQLGKTAEPLLKSGVALAKAYSNGSLIGAVVAGARLIHDAASLRGALALRPVHLSVNNYLRTHPYHVITAVSGIFHANPRWVREQMEAVGSTGATVWRQSIASLNR